VRGYFGFLDRHLEAHPFLAGDAYSVADILALCTLDFAAKLNDLPHSPDQQHLSRWYQAVSSRPSASA
jgi:glutathione S-transferase